MPDSFGNREFHERLYNLGKATQAVASETPGKIWDEINKDMSTPEGQARLAVTGVTSTALGFGTTAMLSKFPKIGPVILVGVAGYQALQYGHDALNFVNQASVTEGQYRRDLLVQNTSARLARESATIIESTPGLVLGGTLAAKTVGVPPLYSEIAGLAQRKMTGPVSSAWRRSTTGEFVAEQWAFRGPGSIKLPPSTIRENGHVNVLEISEMIARRNALLDKAPKVETAHSIDLIKGKISRPARGSENTVDLGFKDKPGRITDHSHPLDSPTGTRPGKFDLQSTRDFGMVRRGNQTAFYEGQAREYQAALDAGLAEQFSPALRALVLDKERQSAFLLESVWQPKTASWTPADPKFVDYQQARQALSNLDITKPWKQFEAISPVAPPRQSTPHEAYSWFNTSTVH